MVCFLHHNDTPTWLYRFRPPPPNLWEVFGAEGFAVVATSGSEKRNLGGHFL